MPTVVTINRPDVVELIQTAAARFTNGNKTEAVAMAIRDLLEKEERARSLFGRHKGSVKVRQGVDLTAPTFDDDWETKASSGLRP